MSYFREFDFSPANIEDYLLNTDIENYICYPKYNQFLTETEIREMEWYLFLLLDLLLKEQKFVNPADINGGTIYRAGKVKAFNGTPEYFPLSKSVASNCPTPGTTQEPIWFSFQPLLDYLGIKNSDEYGIISCRQIHPIDIINYRVNFVINLSTNVKSRCNETSYLLSTDLQTAINKVILVPIIRLYCPEYSKDVWPTDLYYDDILLNKKHVVFRKTVPGYDCDYSRYIGSNTTVQDLLNAWNYIDGTRKSFYNPDRIQAQMLFEILELIEITLNKYDNILTDELITVIQNKLPNQYFPRDAKINLLGTVCLDAPGPEPDCKTFPGEWILSIKYFSIPIRHSILHPYTPQCHPKFYRYSRGNSPYIEIDSIHGGGNKLEYEYTAKPENVNSDLFQTFFADDTNESLYIKTPFFKLLPNRKQVGLYKLFQPKIAIGGKKSRKRFKKRRSLKRKKGFTPFF